MNSTDNKSKTFFQRLTESFINILPLNSPFKKEEIDITKNKNVNITKNSRFASEALHEIHSDFNRSKRIKLHHDPMNFPQTRILKVNNPLIFEKPSILSHFNDASSDTSEQSTTSISTSGVSSLNPHSSRRFNLNFQNAPTNGVTIKNYENKNRLYQQSKSSLLLSDTFISFNARRILDNLDRITTPVSAGDKLFSSKPLQNGNLAGVKYQPYTRNNPSKSIKTPIPTKAVTVSASSNISQCGPLRRKQTIKQHHRLGYFDEENVDLDIYQTSENDIPKLEDSSRLNFSHVPLLKVSRCTNTEEEFYIKNNSPVLDFDFGAPSTIYDYSSDNEHDEDSENLSQNKSTKYEFKRIIVPSEKESNKEEQSKIAVLGLWRCNTCFLENRLDTMICRGCSNISNSNTDKITLTEKTRMDSSVNSQNLTVTSSSIALSQVPPVSNEFLSSSIKYSICSPMPFTLPPPTTFTVAPPMSFSVPPPMPFAVQMGKLPVSTLLDKSQNHAITSMNIEQSFRIPHVAISTELSTPSFSFGISQSVPSNISLPISQNILDPSTKSSVTVEYSLPNPITTLDVNSSVSTILNPSFSFGTSSNQPRIFEVSTTPSLSFGISSASSSVSSLPFGISSATPAASSSPFGISSATPAASSSPFGISSATPAASSSLFGISSATPAASSSLFGISSATPVASSSPFGISSATSAASSSSVGLSSATPAASSSPFRLSSATPAASSSQFGISSATPAASSSQFGISSTTYNISPFQFGIPSVTSAVSSLQFGIPSVTSTISSFSFGIPLATSIVSSLPLAITAATVSSSPFGIKTSASFCVPSMSQSNMFNQSAPSTSFTFGLTPKSESHLSMSQSNPNFASSLTNFAPVSAPGTSIPCFNATVGSNFVFGVNNQQSALDSATPFIFGSVPGNPFNCSSSVPGSMDRMAGGGTSGTRKIARIRRKK